MNLDPQYNPQGKEDEIYRQWEESGMFNPDHLPERNQQGEPYCIMMPPPNRTGTLHMGHAMGMAVQDLLIRFERMRGKKTLWVPGTDHAAIATQVKVEQILIKEGMKDPRKELGREKFLERVIDFAEKSRNTMVSQTRKMGSSCDWSRERYTFDAERNRAVYELFKMMYEDGLIERGYRIVNWDPQFQTTLSDDEVLTKDVRAKLLTFTYDKNFPIAISTTRLETKFGDTAVAVHPDDERYQKYIGKIFEPVFCGKKLSITIVGDAAVDPKFGTGALGVTPAHSMIDAEIAERHSLATVPVIGKDARMLPECGSEFAGLSIEETRSKVQNMLTEQGLLQAVEEIAQALPVAERGGAPVEQLPMEQWFVRVNKPFILRQDTLEKWKKGQQTTLKELMRYAVESGQTRIVPERFEKIYFHWIENLHDWCISRQIWFGHRIPMWYCHECESKAIGRSFVLASRIGGATSLVETNSGAWFNDASKEPRFGSSVFYSEKYPLRCPRCKHDDLGGQIPFVQDPDTLDTWFSAGAWTFSALGWPDEGGWRAHRIYHPTAVLETGYDIVFFWVARMILMTTYATGQIPFRTVYLHGMVRDDQGRKMSKSLDNIINPVDMIEKYGADATRLSLVIGSTPGNDVKLSEEKIAGFRNFTNKLWNISRYILLNVKSAESDAKNPKARTLADRWILSRLNTLTKDYTAALEAYQFSRAGEMLRDFTWSELADWYVEIAKVEGGKDALLLSILKNLLHLWHPFMPFVTEEIWKTVGEKGALMVDEWPKPEKKMMDAPSEKDFSILQSLVVAIRNARSGFSVPPKELLRLTVRSGKFDALLLENMEPFKRLARVVDGGFGGKPKGAITILAQGVEVYLDLGGMIDLGKEKARLEKEIASVSQHVASLESRLGNADFVARAPAEIVEGERKKLEESKARLAALEAQLNSLK
ncbi:MAG: valine--tRNA ligase [Patescibacteria group bacterium]